MQNGKAVEAAEITVQFVNPPKEGKKWGSLKDTKGNYYGGPPAMLAQFQPGETCKIEYTLGGTDGTLKALKQKIGIPKALQKPTDIPPRAQTNPHDSERMWCCAILVALIEAGEVTLASLSPGNDLVRKTYANSWGGDDARKTPNGMDDEIPF